MLSDLAPFLLPLPFKHLARRQRRTGGSEKGRKQIQVDHRHVAAAARLGNAGPTDDERLADAALVVLPVPRIAFGS